MSGVQVRVQIEEAKQAIRDARASVVNRRRRTGRVVVLGDKYERDGSDERTDNGDQPGERDRTKIQHR